MGELIGINELKDMVMAALDKGGDEALMKIVSTDAVRPVVQDGVQKWWKHEVEAKLAVD